MTKYEKIQKQESVLYERLDQLEGCEDNPVYKKEIEEIRKKLFEIREFWQTEFM